MITNIERNVRPVIFTLICSISIIFIQSLKLVDGVANPLESIQSTSSEPKSEDTISPPSLEEGVDAIYPNEHLSERLQARVELFVTVLPDGTVGETSVSLSGGKLFDEAALSAIRQWRFAPARRAEVPIASKIRIPFIFTPPPLPRQIRQDQSLIKKVEAPPLSDPLPHLPSEDSGDEQVIKVVVHGEREARSKRRSVSDFTLEKEILAATPRQEGADVLKSAPGIYIGRAEGPAVAHSYMLRGFDADHGQDIEFHVGGLPINMPSHIHGQGYADLGFLIAEVVETLEVSEGVYDPRQGDFAVAGSIDLSLGVKETERGLQLRTGFGTWDSTKHTLIWAPRGEEEESFGAVQLQETAGFGENRAGQSGSGLFQQRFGRGSFTYRLISIVHAARSDLAGVVRRDDVASGELCFTCVYPFPTARAQNASSSRFLTGFFIDHKGEQGQSGTLGVWIGYDRFRSQTNYTGFLQRSRSLEKVSGQGDLIEQSNESNSLGVSSRYRGESIRLSPKAHGTLELGSDVRLDLIEQSQRLLNASVRNQTWDQRVDAQIQAVDLNAWGDLDWTLLHDLKLRIGGRADLLSYEVDDRLGNFVPSTRPQESFIIGYRRSALGVVAGPRSSLMYRANQHLSLMAAYGEGYRSPQARQLEDGEQAPFSKVKSTDIGLKVELDEALSLSLGAFYTHLTDDISFDADEGRLERIGATERLGTTLHAVTRPIPWLIGALSVTYIKASLLEAPPATAEEPQPPFTKGQTLPFIPPLVVRSDLGIHHSLISDLGGLMLTGKAGVGFSYLAPRPLPFGSSSDPLTLLDLSVGLDWGLFEINFELYNALNRQYASIEYVFPSDWSPQDGLRSRTPASHIAAGSPLSWMITLGVKR